MNKISRQFYRSNNHHLPQELLWFYYDFIHFCDYYCKKIVFEIWPIMFLICSNILMQNYYLYHYTCMQGDTNKYYEVMILKEQEKSQLYLVTMFL